MSPGSWNPACTHKRVSGLSLRRFSHCCSCSVVVPYLIVTRPACTPPAGTNLVLNRTRQALGISAAAQPGSSAGAVLAAGFGALLLLAL